MIESHLGVERFTSLCRLPSITEGRQDRNPEAGTKAEAVEGYCLLAGFSCLLSSLLSYITQDHMPRGGTVHGDMGPPTLI